MVNRFCLDWIEHQEISSQALYIKLYTKPTWPGGFSGVTIGIGYDIGYVTKQQFVKDWTGQLDTVTINKLLPLVGLTGAAAKAAVKKVQDCVINYEAAKFVFENVSIPNSEKQTLGIYPKAALLPGNVYGMLVGMVYNRGTSLNGDRRRELKAIQPLVESKNIIGIAVQFESMRRFWLPSNGLFKRYTSAAVVIRACA